MENPVKKEKLPSVQLYYTYAWELQPCQLNLFYLQRSEADPDIIWCIVNVYHKTYLTSSLGGCRALDGNAEWKSALPIYLLLYSVNTVTFQVYWHVGSDCLALVEISTLWVLSVLMDWACHLQMYLVGGRLCGPLYIVKNLWYGHSTLWHCLHISSKNWNVVHFVYINLST